MASVTARQQAQLAVLALGVIALALGGVLVLRGPAVVAGPADAGNCDATVMPGPLMPHVDDTPLMLWAEQGARVRIDGSALVSEPDAPINFAPGEHALHVECQGAPALEARVYLEPYQPGALFAACGSGMKLVFFGATCRGCPAGTVPDEKAARAQATKAPKGGGLRTLFDAQERLQRAEAARQRARLVQRWNLLTDRYFRVLGALGHDATDAVDSAHFRFEALSKGVTAAQQQNDTIGLDESVRAGEQTLAALITTARKAHAHDCEFQDRLTRSF
jgi:hypothetical protein